MLQLLKVSCRHHTRKSVELYRIELRYKTDLGEQWEGNGRWTEGESEMCVGELQLAYVDYEKA